MGLFNRSTSGNPALPVRDRLLLELVGSADGSVHIAFGLQWYSIAGTGGKDFAIKTAKKRGGTHFLYIGHQVGYGRIDQKRDQLAPGARVFPAAQIAARQYGGDAVHLLSVGDGEYWLCVIRDGHPTTVDEFIHAANDSTVIAKAKAIIDASEEDGVHFTIYTNLNDSSLGRTTRMTTADLLLAASTSDADILSSVIVPKTLNLPAPVMYTILIALLLLLAQEGWKYKKKLDAKRAAALAVPVVEEPPDVAWARAVGDWEKTQAMPSGDDLKAVRASIGKAPARWFGWNLQKISCATNTTPFVAPPVTDAASAPVTPQTQGSSVERKLNKNWGCSATYERGPLGVINTEIAKHTPPGWTLSFEPLNTMFGSWTVKTTADQMRIVDLQTKDFHVLETAANVQGISRALNDTLPMQFRTVAVTAPKKANGTMYAPDTSFIPVLASPITLKIPVRNMDALIHKGFIADWTQIVLSISQTATKEQSNISQSAVAVDLTGNLYAKTK